MYKFVREDAPLYLVTCWETLTRNFIAAKTRNPRYRFIWYKKFKYENTLSLLFNMTKGHCAFCDGGNIGAESRKTIEHFRPKSSFQELAYKWENLYPCCDQCQSQKRERFDFALLIPDDVNYQFNNYFIANYHTGEIEPSGFASEDAQQRARVTIEHYGLNLPERKTSRKRERRRYYQRDTETDIKDDFSYRYFLDDMD